MMLAPAAERTAKRRGTSGNADMTVAMADGSLPASVVTALYLRTKTLHLEAERSGIIRELLRGSAAAKATSCCCEICCLPIRLWSTALRVIAKRRASAPSHITGSTARPQSKSDLPALCGDAWQQEIPLLAAGDRYAGRITEAAQRRRRAADRACLYPISRRSQRRTDPAAAAGAIAGTPACRIIIL